MKTFAKNQYILPNIEKIVLDNEISLALESTPPVGIGEMTLGASNSDNFTEEPFNSSIGSF